MPPSRSLRSLVVALLLLTRVSSMERVGAKAERTFGDLNPEGGQSDFKPQKGVTLLFSPKGVHPKTRRGCLLFPHSTLLLVRVKCRNNVCKKDSVVNVNENFTTPPATPTHLSDLSTPAAQTYPHIFSPAPLPPVPSNGPPSPHRRIPHPCRCMFLPISLIRLSCRLFCPCLVPRYCQPPSYHIPLLSRSFSHLLSRPSIYRSCNNQLPYQPPFSSLPPGLFL